MSNDEEIKYVDVNSLYPFIQRSKVCGLGHPDILMYDEIDIHNIEQYFGVMKCIVLPPQNLHVPVLPYRSGGKLLFPLCRRCAKELSKEECQCPPADRQWVFSGHTAELQLAVKRGYRILCGIELWNYPVNRRCQYNMATGEESIFSTYINQFYKFKVEASGYPHGVTTDADKDAYIADVKRTEGLILDKSNIKHNPGMRYLSKAHLNSLWGKLSQNSGGKTSTQYFAHGQLASFLKFVTKNDVDMTDFRIGNATVAITYRERCENLVRHCPYSNIMLACSITSQARVHLYEAMERAGQRLLYCDTDSVFYIRGPTGPYVPQGDKLGELKDELPDVVVKTFISLGPKNYSYRMTNGDTHVKVKGFTLNYKNSMIINFESMKRMLLRADGDYDDTPGVLETHETHKIKRDRHNAKIYSVSQLKKYRAVNNKRVFFPDFTSKPYGYTN